MTKQIIILTLLSLLILTSCKSKKNITHSTNTKKTLLKEVINNYKKNEFNKKSVSASIKAKYKGKSDLPKVNISLRIKKDKIIWMSISKFISIGKLKITPKRVQFYNNLTNEYFDGDFSLLSNFLGTDISFKQIQNILVGEALHELNTSDYNIEPLDKVYVFEPKAQNNLFDIFFLIYASNFKLANQKIEQNNKQLEISYPAYTKIKTTYFPKEIFIKADDGNQINTIDVFYKSVKFNEKLKFPFKIPNGYKEIKL
jgi:hypothetical protein